MRASSTDDSCYEPIGTDVPVTAPVQVEERVNPEQVVPEPNIQPQVQQPQHGMYYRTRSGREVRPPRMYRE